MYATDAPSGDQIGKWSVSGCLVSWDVHLLSDVVDVHIVGTVACRLVKGDACAVWGQPDLPYWHSGRQSGSLTLPLRSTHTSERVASPVRYAKTPASETPNAARPFAARSTSSTIGDGSPTSFSVDTSNRCATSVRCLVKSRKWGGANAAWDSASSSCVVSSESRDFNQTARVVGWALAA